MFYKTVQEIEYDIRGVWIADETLSRVFVISPQLRSKRRKKIVKNYTN